MNVLRLEKPSSVYVTYLAFSSSEKVARNQSKILKKNSFHGWLPGWVWNINICTKGFCSQQRLWNQSGYLREFGKVSGRLTQQNISGSPQPQSEVGGALLIICTVPAVEACFCFLCNSFRPLVAKTGNTLLFRLKGD